MVVGCHGLDLPSKHSQSCSSRQRKQTCRSTYSQSSKTWSFKVQEVVSCGRRNQDGCWKGEKKGVATSDEARNYIDKPGRQTA